MVQEAERLQQAALRVAPQDPTEGCARLEGERAVLFGAAQDNCCLVRRTWRHPKNHAYRNRRVEAELPQVFDVYRDLCMMSIRARCHDGFRTKDYARRQALGMLENLEKSLPFP